MNANHTPGPWTAECHIHSDGFPFGTVSAGDITVVFVTQNEPEVEANTRLIAAAPELLESLEGIASATCEKWEMSYAEFKEQFMPWARNVSLAAIKKAKGVA